MRIITGIYKGRHFDIPRSFKARPTTDFAKENIFNVLARYIDFEGIKALDLFSGTGSISLELLSRGCEQVVSVEMDRDHHRFITDCLKKLDKTERGKAALVCFAQVIPAVLIVVAMEFAAFEKKITLIQSWPADVCHLLAGLACLWMGMAAGHVWQRVYALQAPSDLVK